MNLPNKLSLIRIIMVPISVALFYMTFIPYNYVLSAAVFAIASFTDFLDGYIARKYNLVTDLGKFLDTIADKVLVLALLTVMLTNPCVMAGSFGYTFGALAGGIGVTIIVARELVVCFLRMIAAGKGKVLAAENVGKIKTFTTDFAILFLLVAVDLPVLYVPGMVLFLISVALTVYSGVYYLVKNRDVF
ncbi:MAG: CDP-diacylglycerol--glycerol-3-phosphate 3-phosphatidyltransferase [Clostridia bacterium]|nr:CDP-diacylglycerol--glycerol-3-phosphate 3-phosphatidyltransferase [Clostridia bacterium]